jgi:hypothetical protein
MPDNLPNRILLETIKEQNVMELTASSLPGKGYRILLVFKFESAKANMGKFTI